MGPSGRPKTREVGNPGGNGGLWVIRTEMG